MHSHETIKKASNNEAAQSAVASLISFMLQGHQIREHREKKKSPRGQHIATPPPISLVLFLAQLGLVNAEILLASL